MSSEMQPGQQAVDELRHQRDEGGHIGDCPHVPILTQLSDGKLTSVNNFDGDTMNRYRLTQIACGPLCGKFIDGEPNIINLCYYFAHVVEMEAKQGGELIDRVRVVWMDGDGKAMGFVSDFMARETDTILSIFGDGPFRPPLRMEVLKAKSNRGMTFYTCRPAAFD